MGIVNPPTGGTSSSILNVVTITAATTVTSANDVVLVNATSAGFAITLPDATLSSSKKAFYFKRVDQAVANIVTFTTVSSQTIDGLAASFTNLYTLNESFEISSDGANWQILEHKSNTTFFNAAPVITTTGGGTAPVFGTAQTNLAWQRVGSMARITLQIKQTVAGTAGTTGDYIVAMPPGLTFDNGTGRLTGYTTAVFGAPAQWAGVTVTTFGGGSIGSGATATGSIVAIPYDATHFRVGITSYSNGGTLQTGLWSTSASGYPISTAALAVSLDFWAPIANWKE